MGPLEKLGAALLKLGENPKSYYFDPPARATGGLSPTFGINRIVEIPRRYFVGDQNNIKSVLGVENFNNDENFVKAIIDDPEVMRYELADDPIYGRFNTVPDNFTGELSVIDSMILTAPKGGGRGVKEYYRLWDDDVENNRLNISTLLTPRNEIRRPVNMMNYLVRRPEAGSNIRLYDDPSSYMDQWKITPDEYENLSVEEKIGYLAAKERENQRRYIPSHMLYMPPKTIEGMIHGHTYALEPRLSVMGAHSINRGQSVEDMMKMLKRGADIDTLVEKYSGKPLFKSDGGLAKLE